MSKRLLDNRYRPMASCTGRRGGTCLVLSWASTTVSFSSLQSIYTVPTCNLLNVAMQGCTMDIFKEFH